MTEKEERICDECYHYGYDIYVDSNYMESIIDERCNLGHSFLDANDCPDYDEME